MLKIAMVSLFGLALASTMGGKANADPILWRTEDGGNGHYYDLILTPSLNWFEAKAAAEALSFDGISGVLAIVTSQAENDFIEATFKTVQANGRNVHAAWIGLTDSRDFGGMESADPSGPNWVWLTGEAVQFTNWLPGEPNNYQAEKFGEFVFDVGGLWNNLSAFDGSPDRLAVVEFRPTAVPEPWSFAMLGSGGYLVLLLGHRNRLGRTESKCLPSDSTT